MSIEDAGAALAVGGADSGSSGGDAGGSGGYEGGNESHGADDGAGGGEAGSEAAVQEFEIDPATGEQKLDAEGNPVPKQVNAKADFKTNYEKLKAADPKAADIYRKQHFEVERYKQAFPTSAEALQAKELFESYGGAEGIETINNQAQQFAEEMDQFANGDGNLYDTLAKENPEALAKGAPHFLRNLAKNAEAYTAALSPIVTATLEQAGISASISEAGTILADMYASLKTSNPAAAAELSRAFQTLKKGYDGVQGLKTLAEKGAERPLTDREKQVQEREKALDKQKNDAYRAELTTKVNAVRDDLTGKALASYFKQVPKMTPEQKKDLMDGVDDHVMSQLNSNKKYLATVKTLMNQGDQAKVVNYIQNNIQKIVADSAKKVWNRRGFGSLPNTARPAAGAQNNATVNLTVKPKHTDVDWEKTSQTDFMSGTAVLRGTGKRVKWDWAQQK